MRYIAGILLLIAATLKAWSPAETVSLETAYSLPQSASVVLVGAEWLLGTLLLTGVWPRETLRIALVAFAIFAGFSFYRGLSGYQSCGCFGAVRVHPWATFALDLFIIALLAWSVRQTPAFPPAPRRSIAFAAVSWLLLGGTVFGLSYVFQPQTIAASSDAEISEGGLVILEPETWGGKRLPIGKHISPSTDLAEGDWTLLLFHHNCPDCQAALPYYQELAEQLREKGDGRLLLIEIPPYGPDSQHNSENSARLSDKVDWFVQAPVEIQVKNGIVQQASRDLPSIAAFRGQIDDHGSGTMVRAAKPIVD